MPAIVTIRDCMSPVAGCPALLSATAPKVAPGGGCALHVAVRPPCKKAAKATIQRQVRRFVTTILGRVRRSFVIAWPAADRCPPAAGRSAALCPPA